MSGYSAEHVDGQVESSSPAPCWLIKKNILVGTAVPLRGRHFQDFCYGGVGGGPPDGAPVPLGFGFQTVADFMENLDPLSPSASHTCAAAFCLGRVNTSTASHCPLHCCAVLKCGNCSRSLSFTKWPYVHIGFRNFLRARSQAHDTLLLPPLASTGFCLQLSRMGMWQIVAPRL
jgi:hypothetical protein